MPSIKITPYDRKRGAFNEKGEAVQPQEIDTSKIRLVSPRMNRKPDGTGWEPGSSIDFKDGTRILAAEPPEAILKAHPAAERIFHAPPPQAVQPVRTAEGVAMPPGASMQPSNPAATPAAEAAAGEVIAPVGSGDVITDSPLYTGGAETSIAQDVDPAVAGSNLKTDENGGIGGEFIAPVRGEGRKS